MMKKRTIKNQCFGVFILFLGLFTLLPSKSEACIDPDTIITVTTYYNTELTELVVVLGNLKFMTEAPNVFCTCALGSFTDVFSNLEYVAFVETGTNIPYGNMAPWENNSTVDQAWSGAYPDDFGSWTGFIAEVINNGLGPQDDVELLIRLSLGPGYFVSIMDMDTTWAQSSLGTDAWSVSDSDLIGDHPGIRNLKTDNSSYEFIEVSDTFFDDLDDVVLSTDGVPENIRDLLISPNPNSGSFDLLYSLSEGAIINLNVYDVSGKLIHSISQGFQSEGVFRETIHLPKGKIGSGIYLLEITSEESRVFEKLIISE